MNITHAKLKDLNTLSILFNDYRVFYEQESDLVAAKRFLTQRFIKNDSVIYVALANDKAIGFTQLFPLYSSVTMSPIYLLNDLYVDSEYRNQGIGEALINRAKQLCKSGNNKGLAIQTAFDNPAQHLYERLGFVKDTDLQFFWNV